MRLVRFVALSQVILRYGYSARDFILQLALVDNVGAVHPLVLGNIEQRYGCSCNFSSFSSCSSNS
jgi:hypothetical protein